MALVPEQFSLRPLSDALKTLEDALIQHRDDLTRDGCIQRFEYTFELAWKTLKKYLEMNSNIREDNLKNIFREAGKQGLIESVEQWFQFQVARNKTSHIYSHKVAAEVFEQTKQFAPTCRKLVQKLEALLV